MCKKNVHIAHTRVALKKDASALRITVLGQVCGSPRTRPFPERSAGHSGAVPCLLGDRLVAALQTPSHLEGCSVR
jgi:hypothetical protein